jgi:hypothetical protein
MKEKDSEIEDRIRENGYLESIYNGDEEDKKELINQLLSNEYGPIL